MRSHQSAKQLLPVRFRYFASEFDRLERFPPPSSSERAPFPVLEQVTREEEEEDQAIDGVAGQEVPRPSPPTLPFGLKGLQVPGYLLQPLGNIVQTEVPLMSLVIPLLLLPFPPIQVMEREEET